MSEPSPILRHNGLLLTASPTARAIHLYVAMSLEASGHVGCNPIMNFWPVWWQRRMPDVPWSTFRASLRELERRGIAVKCNRGFKNAFFFLFFADTEDNRRFVRGDDATFEAVKSLFSKTYP